MFIKNDSWFKSVINHGKKKGERGGGGDQFDAPWGAWSWQLFHICDVEIFFNRTMTTTLFCTRPTPLVVIGSPIRQISKTTTTINSQFLSLLQAVAVPWESREPKTKPIRHDNHLKSRIRNPSQQW
jgi:hypothetical protein